MTLVLAPPGGSFPWHVHHLVNRLLALAAGRRQSLEIPRSVVSKAQQGNHAAFRKIVRHYDDRLRALAYRLLEDREAMDDALQEAYVKAFRSLGGFKGGSSLGTWLYRITYNTCMDELRRRDNVLPLIAPGGQDLQLQDPVDAIDAAVTKADIAAALSDLPPEQRAAIVLIDADGWAYEEAAKVLGIPPGTVASRVSRGRAALRKALEASR